MFYACTESFLPKKELEIYERTEHLRSSCSQIPPQRNLQGKVLGRVFFISERHSLSYCKVAETGSTFWSQVFLALAGFNPAFHDYEDAETVFDMSLGEIKTAISRQHGLTMDWDDKRVKLTTSFLVAKNPYSRLFSTYIDQIYLPLHWGKAMKMTDVPKRQECGSDITFQEFLKFISDSLLSQKHIFIDWAPIFTNCVPCETQISIVAKEETFAEDVDIILDYVGAESTLREQARLVTNGYMTDKNIAYLVGMYISKGHAVNRGCITEQKLAEKLWTAFQIQGYIRDDIAFPAEKLKSVMRDDLEEILTELIINAVHSSDMSIEERNDQKRKWKLMFWRQVSKETILNVQAAFYEDFHLFKYEIDPNKM